jgi:crotonobetainyl-CoA:carnitine CoA-transferase CaiB-like acyl-CoA transferase
MNLS